MLNESMKSELFVELSDEQQQFVAGGGQLIGMDQIAKTYLDLYQQKSNTTILKEVSSNLGGSNVKFGVSNTYEQSKFGTGGLEDVLLHFS